MDTKKVNPITSYSIALGVIALAFLAGITGGCLLSAQGGAAADSAVSEYLFSLAQSGFPRPAVRQVLSGTLLYPALCFILGFAIPGIALIPLTVCARGFFLSYAVASCARVFGGGDGVLFSLALLGIPLLLSLPCLFWLGTHGMMGSMTLLGSVRKKPVKPIKAKEGFIRFGIVLCALAAAAAVEIYISPVLANLAVQKL